MIGLIILAVQIPFYIVCWRTIFKKIAYWYVVQQRANAPQLKPDWGDVGYGIVGATIASCFWPVMMIVAISSYLMDRTDPMVVAEKLGGKAPPEVRKALLDYTTRQLEIESGIIEDDSKPIRGQIV